MDTVLFDWDGTLADSLTGLFEANVVVMRAFGLPFDRTLYARHATPDWRLMYRRLGVPAERMDEANRLWLEAYASGSGTTLLPGAIDALRRLHAAGFRLGLVTAGHREVVAPQLRRLDVEGFFPVRVFGDDTVAQKPDPAPLRRALTLMGEVDPATVTYVGDTVEDMGMARATGVTPVGVASALGDPAALLAAGAQQVRGSVADWVEAVLPAAHPPHRAPGPLPPAVPGPLPTGAAAPGRIGGAEAEGR